MELLPSDVESKTFRVVKKGYDPDEVHAYLKKTGIQMSGLEERAKIALVKADRLERKLLDAQRSADPVAGAYDDGMEIRRRLIAEAEEEAERIRFEAAGSADPFRGRDEKAVRTVYEADEILDGARAEAGRIEQEAHQILARARSTATDIDTEAAHILAEARARADRIIAEATADANRIRADVSVQDVGQPADGSALREPASSVYVDLEEEDVTVDLTDREPAAGAPKPSRYVSRSAGLPRIGEGAGSVLGDMQKVRMKDGS